MKLPPQLARLLLLIVGIISTYAVARFLLTPPSFGEYGWYRGDGLREIASKTPVFAGKKACDECHSEILEAVDKAEHKSISCETCHGIGSAHVENPDLKPTKITDTHCNRCHERQVARPAWLKQIVPREHYTGQRCTECHLPHQPNEVP